MTQICRSSKTALFKARQSPDERGPLLSRLTADHIKEVMPRSRLLFRVSSYRAKEKGEADS